MISRLKKYPVYLCVILLHSLLLIVLTGYFQSLSLNLGKENYVLTGMEVLKTTIGGEKNIENPDDYIFINTSYSKQFIPKYDENGALQGQDIITSRVQLFNLLKKLEGSSYKYMILDIFFDSKTPQDTLIEQALFKLNNKIIPYHINDNDQILEPVITSNMGLADINTIGGFVSKYKIYDRDRKLLPLIMYEELFEQQYTNYGPFGRIDNRFLTTSFPLSFRIRNSNLFDQENEIKNTQIESKMKWRFYELASLEQMPSSFLSKIVEGRILVIGDFNNDKFDSYVGKISGPLVLLNAFLSIKYGDPFLSWPFSIFLLIVYILLSYLIFKPHRTIVGGRKKVKINQFLRPVRLLMIIVGITLISYLVFDNYLSLFFLSIYILLIDYLVRLIYFLSPRIKAVMGSESESKSVDQ